MASGEGRPASSVPERSEGTLGRAATPGSREQPARRRRRPRAVRTTAKHLPDPGEAPTMPSRRDALKALALGSAGVLAGGAARYGAWSPDVHQPADGTWPQPRYGPRNTAHSPDASPPTDAPEVVARHEVSDAVLSVRVGAERTYAGTEHAVWAFDRDGERGSAWSQSADARQLAVGPDAVIAGGRGQVAGLAPESGEVLWQHDTETHVRSVLAGERTAYVGGYDELAAFDATTGRRRWRLSTKRDTRPGFDGDGRLLVAGDGADAVHAYDPRSDAEGVLANAPTRTWTATEASGATYPVVTESGGLFVGKLGCPDTYPCGVVALRGDGTADWTAEPGPNLQHPAFDGERVYVASARFGDEDGVSYRHDATLHALDAETGDELWAFQRGERFASPIVADGTVYVAGEGSPNGNLHALDAETGDRLWTHDANGANAVVAVEDALVVGTADGRVLELR